MVENENNGMISWKSYPELEDIADSILRTELPISHIEFDSAGKNM